MAAAPGPGEAPLVSKLLALEHSLLYGSLAARGMAGTHEAAGSFLQVLDASVTAHRALRDQLNDLLDHWRVSAPPASAAYVLPAAPRDAEGSLTIAIAMEDRCTSTWLDAIARTTDTAMRSLCASSIEQAAVRASRLRRASGVALDKSAGSYPGR